MKNKRNIRRRSTGSTLEATDLHPVLRRVYAGRRVSSCAELDYSLANLLPYHLLGNIDAAARLLASALQQQRGIVIVADYDADGATACALAVRGLRMMGALDVQFIVPDRFVHGYGLSEEIVELAAALGPGLLITVDNGISSIAGVRLARSRGMDVLITDHHLPGDELPAANVIVNPNLAGDSFPSKSLAGVGVMFYVLAALRARLREDGWFDRAKIAPPNLAALLDLVALGTVADVVALDFNNRILVAQGLKRIREGRSVAGIRALLSVAERPAETIVSSDLGFSIGPRLNAAGRLTDMRLGIDCLLSEDPVAALQMATRLDQLNRERRDIQAGMENEALAVIDTLELQAASSLSSALCLYQQHWHQGVIGVLAAKIRERTGRPVIAFANENGAVLKGSARSIRDVHIRDAIETIATAHSDLVLKYGGHAMAAGLSIRLEHLDTFARLFDREIKRRLLDADLDTDLLSDGELQDDEFTIELAEQFRNAGPWGQGFPEPQFDGQFSVLDSRVLGGKHLKLQLCTNTENKAIEAIAFNTTDELWPAACSRVRALYRLDINEYRGRRKPQLVVEYIEPLDVA